MFKVLPIWRNINNKNGIKTIFLTILKYFLTSSLCVISKKSTRYVWIKNKIIDKITSLIKEIKKAFLIVFSAPT